MWKIQPCDEFIKRVKKCEKRSRRELENVNYNLNRFLEALNEGSAPAQVSFGFIHVEPMGVVAIDQSGPGRSLKETRLYTYPETETQILYVITIGDKSRHGQQQDVATCREFVAERRKIIADEQKNVQQRGGDGPRNHGRPAGGDAAG